MHSIACTGKDGIVRNFIFDDGKEDISDTREIFFCVKMQPPKDDLFFELQLREKPDGQWQIIEITHHYLEEYKSKGIPDNLLPYLTKHLGQPICSSRVYVEGKGEFRTGQATGMWERLAGKGLAKYYTEEGIYRTVMPDGMRSGVSAEPAS